MLILNFHGVGPITREIDDGERNCWLDQSAFEAVLDAVKGRDHVRLTVDDGNESDFTFILPALLKRGLKAEFFVCSERVDQPTFLSRAQIGGLQEQGMAIGSHGAAHRPWRHLPPSLRETEIAGSRAALEAICGRTIDTAACPFGAYDRHVLGALKAAGYRIVYTSDGGSADKHQWMQARTTVTRSMSLDEIRHLVESGPGILRQTSINLRKSLKRLRS